MIGIHCTRLPVAVAGANAGTEVVWRRRRVTTRAVATALKQTQLAAERAIESGKLLGASFALEAFPVLKVKVLHLLLEYEVCPRVVVDLHVVVVVAHNFGVHLLHGAWFSAAAAAGVEVDTEAIFRAPEARPISVAVGVGIGDPRANFIALPRAVGP